MKPTQQNHVPPLGHNLPSYRNQVNFCTNPNFPYFMLFISTFTNAPPLPGLMCSLFKTQKSLPLNSNMFLTLISPPKIFSDTAKLSKTRSKNITHLFGKIKFLNLHSEQTKTWHQDSLWQDKKTGALLFNFWKIWYLLLGICFRWMYLILYQKTW